MNTPINLEEDMIIAKKEKVSINWNSLIGAGTFLLVSFFVGWLLAATFAKFNIVEFHYPQSFKAVTSEQVNAYRKTIEEHGPTDFLSFMETQEPAVFYWEDIVQFRVEYCKHYPLPVEVDVSLMPQFPNGTITQYVARHGGADEGCADSFLLSEQVRPGTIPGKYKMKINYIYTKPIGGRQVYTIETQEFEVKEHR